MNHNTYYRQMIDLELIVDIEEANKNLYADYIKAKDHKLLT